MQSIVKINEDKETRFNETGILQFFFHSPESDLPVRDIIHKHKTEPHIEIGAENYISCCYQPNLKQFVEKNEKYLFLITTCKNKEQNRKLDEMFGKQTHQFIVGYIMRDTPVQSINGKGKKHICIKGKPYIYSFEDSVRVKEIFGKNYSRVGNEKTYSLLRDSHVDKDKTEKILTRFKGRDNILDKCIEKIKQLELDKKNDKEHKTCLVLRGGNCKHQYTDCLRWKNEGNAVANRN